MPLSVSLLLNKPHTQESTALLMRWAGTTKDHIGVVQHQSLSFPMPGSPEPLIPLRPHGSFSPPPFSLCLFHVLLFLSRALYRNISPFFFLTKSQALLPISWEVKLHSAEI